MTRRVFSICPFGILTGALLAGTHVQAQTPPPPAPRLTVVSEPGLTTATNGAAVFDTGIVDPQKAARVDHTFTLRNNGTQPIAVARLRPSCGCETLLLAKSGKTVTQTTLAPGETIQVHVGVRTVGQPAGILHKYIWVEAADPAIPLATLEVQLQVREPSQAAPTFLNFGTAASGAAHTLPLVVTVDKDVLPDGKLPDLVSTLPVVRAVPVGTPLAVLRDGRASVQQAYRVTLAEAAPAGRLSGSLRFQGTVPALATLSVPVVGDVTGHITASPKTVFFGSVVGGKPLTRQVLLTLSLHSVGATLTVSGGGPSLTTSLRAPMPGAGGVRVLDVTLSAHAPVGLLQSQVVVTVGADRLVLPVTADVVAP